MGAVWAGVPGYRRLLALKEKRFKAGGRRVNMSEPAGEFYAASLFLLRFLWRLTKNEEVRAVQYFVRFYFSDHYITIYKTRLY